MIMVYKHPGVHDVHKGKFAHITIPEEHLEIALKRGWCRLPVEAKEKSVGKLITLKDERDEVEAINKAAQNKESGKPKMSLAEAEKKFSEAEKALDDAQKAVTAKKNEETLAAYGAAEKAFIAAEAALDAVKAD